LNQPIEEDNILIEYFKQSKFLKYNLPDCDIGLLRCSEFFIFVGQKFFKSKTF